MLYIFKNRLKYGTKVRVSFVHFATYFQALHFNFSSECLSDALHLDDLKQNKHLVLFYFLPDE